MYFQVLPSDVPLLYWDFHPTVAFFDVPSHVYVFSPEVSTVPPKDTWR